MYKMEVRRILTKCKQNKNREQREKWLIFEPLLTLFSNFQMPSVENLKKNKNREQREKWLMFEPLLTLFSNFQMPSVENLKKIHVSNISLRFLSVDNTSRPKTTYTHIDKNVTFEQHSTPSQVPRPLVIILGWMFAKPVHLRKFSSIYIDEGFDVVTVRIRPAQLLFPKKTKSLINSVMDFCQDGDRKHQPLMSHGFSVGGYMYGEFLVSLLDDPDRYASIRNRMYGQVFDSPVDFDQVPTGLSRAMTDNKKVQSFIRKPVQWYLTTFKSTMSDYIRASNAFHSNDLKLPSIYFYSKNDPVVDPELIEKLAANWCKRNIEASTVFWQDAPHVCTFKHHPDQYKQHLLKFILNIGIKGNNQDVVEKKRVVI